MIGFQEVINLWTFEFSVSDVILPNVQNISPLVFFTFFVRFMEKKPPMKFCGVFVYYSRTYEVAKFWMIKFCLDVGDVILEKVHTKYANYGLLVNFWIFSWCNFVLGWKRIVLSKSCYFGFQINISLKLWKRGEKSPVI